MRSRVALTLLVAVAVVAAACSNNRASTSQTVTSAKVTSNGAWPGVGKICESGPGGTSTARGVSQGALHLAVFSDAGNSIQPGLNVEFFQAASAFSKWCNASGGIDGRKIVVDDEDAALFNAAQVTSQACQKDFMSVAGGMALDQPSVSVRVGCGLGQINAFDVSSEAVDAKLQVNPTNTNDTEIEAGWYGALATVYPSAIKLFGTGAQNNPSILAPANKWRDAAETQGYKVVDYQVPPLMVTDWTPYVEEAQSKGVQALEPSDDSNIAPFVQAMNTAGYSPTFMLLTTQFYASSTTQAAESAHFPTTYVAIQNWPFELASQSPGLEQMDAIMHKYAPGETVDFDDENAFDSWALFAKAATSCGSDVTVACVLRQAASQTNWTAGGLQAPVAHLAMSDAGPMPSDCFALMQVEPGKFVYSRSITDPNSQIWHCGANTLFHVPVNG